ncbi:hypothetical protein TNCV_1532771 [Trichonephila clavipes]|nr:hypothetical protein TNCV_1532771 [Trichonephila clavipes]
MGVAGKSNSSPSHDTGCRTSVAMYNATVQKPLTTTVSPNSNPTIVMFLAEARFVSKHNVVPFRCPCPPFITSLAKQTLVVSSQGLTKQWTPCGHSILLQTVSNGTSVHRLMRNRLNKLCYGSWCNCAIHHCHAHNPSVITGSAAMRWVWSARSFPPASSDDRSAAQLLGFVEHNDLFL